MNASMAIVIVGDEQNNSLSWTSNFPPVLLTDELTVSDNQTDDKCNNFGRVALLSKPPELHCVSKCSHLSALCNFVQS